MSIVAIHEKVPKEIKKVLLRAFVLFVAWKLIYHLLLSPNHVVDRNLNLTTAKGTALIYKAIHTSAYINTSLEINDRAAMYVNGRKSLTISDPCNGLELIVVYFFYLLCLLKNIKWFLTFATLGIATIYVLNCIRCYFLLSLVGTNVFDMMHHYIFNTIMYILIFVSWTIYTNKQ